MPCRDKGSAPALPHASQGRSQGWVCSHRSLLRPWLLLTCPRGGHRGGFAVAVTETHSLGSCCRSPLHRHTRTRPCAHPPPITPAFPCPGAAPCKHCRSCVNTGPRYFPHLSLADRRAAPFPRKNKPTQWRRRVQQVFPQISSMSREVAVNRLTAQRQPWKFLTASFLSQIHTSAFPPGP